MYIVLHQKHKELDMATGPKNAKSQSVTARIAHEIIEGMEKWKKKAKVQGSYKRSHAWRDQTPPAPQGQRAGVTITSAVVRVTTAHCYAGAYQWTIKS